jgi:hypothetical protein
LHSDVLSVYLFLKVARHILPTAAVPMALGFFVISEPLIYYCTEAKRYAVAILATLALFNLIFSLHNKDLSLRQAIIFGVSGSMILWFSYPSIFVTWRYWTERALLCCGSKGLVPRSLHFHRQSSWAHKLSALLWSFYVLLP